MSNKYTPPEELWRITRVSFRQSMYKNHPLSLARSWQTAWTVIPYTNTQRGKGQRGIKEEVKYTAYIQGLLKLYRGKVGGVCHEDCQWQAAAVNPGPGRNIEQFDKKITNNPISVLSTFSLYELSSPSTSWSCSRGCSSPATPIKVTMVSKGSFQDTSGKCYHTTAASKYWGIQLAN